MILRCVQVFRRNTLPIHALKQSKRKFFAIVKNYEIDSKR